MKLPRPVSTVWEILNDIPLYLTPQVTQATPFTINGAQADVQSLGVEMAQLAANSQSVAGGINLYTTAATAITLTNLGNALYQFNAGSSAIVTFDYAYNIANNLPKPLTVGQQFTFAFQTTASTPVSASTLSDSAITFAGTANVTTGSIRYYQGTLSQVNSQSTITFTPGTSFTSLTQVGSTNAFTLALGTNTVSPPIGSLVHITVTAGTLPTGWYPVAKVTSATSFVIMTPLGTVWTMTAGTVEGSPLIPPPTYSPLITINGYMATAASTVTL